MEAEHANAGAHNLRYYPIWMGEYGEEAVCVQLQTDGTGRLMRLGADHSRPILETVPLSRAMMGAIEGIVARIRPG